MNSNAYVNFRNYAMRKIPHVIITAYIIIAHSGFKNCPVGNKYKEAYIATMAVLSILCFAYEFFDAYVEFVKVYNNPTKKSLYGYCILSSLVSLLMFLSLSFVIFNGQPYSCYYPYDDTIALILFCLSVVIVVGVSGLEHYFWNKISYESF